jgi:hypothetical protein
MLITHFCKAASMSCAWRLLDERKVLTICIALLVTLPFTSGSASHRRLLLATTNILFRLDIDSAKDGNRTEPARLSSGQRRSHPATSSCLRHTPPRSTPPLVMLPMPVLLLLLLLQSTPCSCGQTPANPQLQTPSPIYTRSLTLFISVYLFHGTPHSFQFLKQNPNSQFSFCNPTP